MSNNQFKQALLNRDLLTKVRIGLSIKLRIINPDLQQQLVRYNLLKKYLRKYRKKVKSYELDSLEHTKIVWVCWLQGFENAPNLVKICLSSIKKHAHDFKVIELDQSNIFDYVDLPNHIIAKWKSGTISNAHFSDILRCALLVQNGGLWLDSTVLLTGDIHPLITVNPTLSAYSNFMSTDPSILFDSWFIYSVKNQPLLRSTLDLLYLYWLKKNHLSNYFLFHIFMTIASLTNSQTTHYNIINPISSHSAHYLQKCLNNPFDFSYFQYILDSSPVHKLTYKFENIIPGSYLSKLLGVNDENNG